MLRILLITVIITIFLTPLTSNAGYGSCGVFGGYHQPVIVPESREGYTFGFKIRLKLAYAFFLEPYYLQNQEKDREVITTGGIKTYDGTFTSSAGVNIVVGTYLNNLVRPYAIVGIGIFKTKDYVEGAESSQLGSNWGGGLEYSLVWKKLYIDLGATLQVIECDDGGMRKNMNFTTGLNWYFKLK